LDTVGAKAKAGIVGPVVGVAIARDVAHWDGPLGPVTIGVAVVGDGDEDVVANIAGDKVAVGVGIVEAAVIATAWDRHPIKEVLHRGGKLAGSVFGIPLNVAVDRGQNVVFPNRKVEVGWNPPIDARARKGGIGAGVVGSGEIAAV